MEDTARLFDDTSLTTSICQSTAFVSEVQTEYVIETSPSAIKADSTEKRFNITRAYVWTREAVDLRRHPAPE